MKTRNDILTALKTLTRTDKEWLRDEIDLQLASADEFEERALYLAFRRRLSIRMPYTGMLSRSTPIMSAAACKRCWPSSTIASYRTGIVEWRC